jgi:hypothetical protein
LSVSYGKECQVPHGVCSAPSEVKLDKRQSVDKSRPFTGWDGESTSTLRVQLKHEPFTRGTSGVGWRVGINGMSGGFFFRACCCFFFVSGRLWESV